MKKLFSWYKSQSKYEEPIEEIIELKDLQTDPDRRCLYMGLLDDKWCFLIILLLYSVGTDSIFVFPNDIYNCGGATFICVYLILLFFINLPLYILEVGLGQFYSRTIIYIANIVPLFRGLGWSMILLNCCASLSYQYRISCSFMYLVYSCATSMPWTYCNDRYPKVNCTQTASDASKADRLPIFLTSYQIFYDIDVTGMRTKETGLKYLWQDGISGFRSPFFFCSISIWIIIFASCFMVLRFNFKFLIGTIFCITFVLIIITLRVIFLPGAWGFIATAIYPDLKKSFSLRSIQAAMTHILFSAGFGMGVLSAYSCLNDFNYNFYNTTRLTILGNLGFGLISSIMEFSVVGYIHYVKKNNRYVSEIKINTFIEGVASLRDVRFLTILYSFLLVSVGLTSISIGMGGVILTMMDRFPHTFRYSNTRKLAVCVILCLGYCLTALFFSLNGSYIYQKVFSMHMENFTSPLLIFYEVITVFYIYGAQRLRSEMKMILSFSYNCLWIFSSLTLIPLLLCFSFTFGGILTLEYKTNKNLKILTFLFSFVILFPVNFMFLKELYESSKSHKNFEIIFNAIKTPDILGPYYKVNWLLSKTYQKKLVKVRKDPKFLKTIRETEDLNEILSTLSLTLKKLRIEKSRSTYQTHSGSTLYNK